MSRAIKFRAWETNVRKYYYNAEHTYDFMCIGEGCYSESFGTVLDDERFIVEQYTGLKDKNGKEIYEGDIVEAKIQGLWQTGPNTICEGKAIWNLEVIYNDIRYMDVFHILGSKNQPNRMYYLFDKSISDVEVIGNIHENHDLLEGK